MATLGNVFQLFKDLKTEFSKGSRDLKKCGDLLEQLKVKIWSLFRNFNDTTGFVCR